MKGSEHEGLCQGGTEPSPPPTAWDLGGKRPWAEGEAVDPPDPLSLPSKQKWRSCFLPTSMAWLGHSSPRWGGGRTACGEHLACLVTPARTEAVRGICVQITNPQGHGLVPYYLKRSGGPCAPEGSKLLCISLGGESVGT